MAEQMKLRTSMPPWWTEKHTSDWDNVKAALERDWEQTKADFSEGSGRNLNQNVADTIAQSVGSEPIPPLGSKTRQTEMKVAAREAEEARQYMEQESAKASETMSKAQADIAYQRNKLTEKVSEVREGLAIQEVKAREKVADAAVTASEKNADARVKALGKIADAQDEATQAIEKGQAKVREAGARRDEAIAKWRDAEQEVRYGYCVRSQYPADHAWSDELEGKLQSEWEALHTGLPWRASRDWIRRGWDYASKR
jgi:hypothetical protein